MKNNKTELAISAINLTLLLLLIVMGFALGGAGKPVATLLILATAAGLSSISIAALGILRVIRAGQRADLSRWARAEKSLSRLEWLTAKVPDIAGSVSGSRNDLRALLERDARIPSTGDSSLASLDAVPVAAATAAIRAAGPTGAGRKAGGGGNRPENAPRLLRWIGGRPSESLNEGLEDVAPSRVGVIGPRQLLDSLPRDTEGLSLLPGTARALASQARLDALLIDNRAFIEGPWVGGLDAPGTALFIELWDILRYFRSAGTVVVLIRHGRPVNHFTRDLESQCSLILDGQEYDLGYGNDAKIPLVDHVLAHIEIQESTR